MRRSKVKLIVVPFVFLSVLTLSGQAPAPTLSEVQRLQLQAVTQRLQIAQLQSQLAQRDFDAARVELNALVATLQVKGYTFDPATLTYKKEQP